jgi:hypothetical protein
VPRVDERGGIGKQVVKLCLSALIVGWRSYDMYYSRDLVFFRLVAPPLQPGVMGLLSWYEVYGSSVVYRWREPFISRILGRNRRPRIPVALYPNKHAIDGSC